MDLTPYVANLRHELAVATEAGDEEARALAERLAATLETATRLALLNALSDATREITRDLAPGELTAVPVPRPAPVAATEAPEDHRTSRINVRLPAALKPTAERATAVAGVSLNSWLVRAVSDALEPDGNRGSVAFT
ncbi:hypothetical protein [Streptomyces lasiicapitis]|uniref:Toxin-antitoxin system HicB family antitoxin n=1 Tax=Streptomyces lasiicapitis TaxID=1923961 RepID=A0ABQ2LKA0_9ACTN|nr:hypothetical protein [Streptomyces lasiicapitis]GGO37458.1 hypothetical protein GCM10012286_10950 [Streptomyces lasiicapitis]